VKNQHIFSGKCRILAGAIALSLMPLAASAAGLGRITVFSALGQPLRAEVQLSASPEELAGMSARLASPDAFHQANVDYVATLSKLQFTVEKRATGGAVVKLSSDAPINDPFLDLLLELDWRTGRLVREYTFLLDPPEVAAQATYREGGSIAPPSPRQPVVKPALTPKEEAERLADSLAHGGKLAENPAEKKTAPENAAKPQAPAVKPHPAASSPETAKTVVVKRGDTLAKVARANLEPGVSLDQMLVGLFEDNPAAFDGKNMNRLKTGAILKITPAEKAEALPAKEVQKTIKAQTANWNAYRRKLAESVKKLPASSEQGGRAAGGTVETPVANMPKPAAASDEVKVSGGTQKGQGGASKEEALIARDKALQESQERVKELEKNVTDLQSLLSMTQQRMASLESQLKQQGSAAKAGTANEPPAAAKAAEAVQPAAGNKPQEAPNKPEAASTAVPVPAGQQAQAQPVQPPEKAAAATPPQAQPQQQPTKPAAKPAAPKAAPKPPKKPMASAETPAEAPSMMDGMMLPIGGLVVVLALAGLWFWRRKKAAAAAESEPAIDLAALAEKVEKEPPSPLPSPAAAEPEEAPKAPEAQAEAGYAGGQPPADAGGLQASATDAVAAAELMLSKGEEQEAENILLDALQKEDRRLAIYNLLLGIYAKRGSAKQFETLASELYALTGGLGEEWAMAEEMGRQLGLDNPLFAEAPVQAAGVPASLPDDHSLDFSLPASPVAPADAQAAKQAQEDKELAAFLSAQEEPAAGTPPSFSFDGLDLNLGEGQEAPAAAAASPAPAPAANAEPDEVETKLELALAYEDMGDLEGARDLLGEVVSDGSPAQVEKAKAAQARIAAAGGAA
jgi:pilus assembly protein FimV